MFYISDFVHPSIECPHHLYEHNQSTNNISIFFSLKDGRLVRCNQGHVVGIKLLSYSSQSMSLNHSAKLGSLVLQFLDILIPVQYKQTQAKPFLDLIWSFFIILSIKNPIVKKKKIGEHEGHSVNSHIKNKVLWHNNDVHLQHELSLIVIVT